MQWRMAMLALAFGIIGCGGGGGDSGSTTSPPPPPPPASPPPPPPPPPADFNALTATALAANENPVSFTGAGGQGGDPLKPGRQQYYGCTTDDYWIHPFVDVYKGTKNGFDIYGTVDTSEASPGVGEIDGHLGSFASGTTFWTNGDKPGDLFLLGDSVGPYYAGKTSAAAAEADFVYVYRVERPGAIFRMHGRASDYRTGRAVNPETGNPGTGIFYVATGTNDLIAYLDNVELSDADLSTSLFEYDKAPGSTPVVQGLAQFGNRGYQLFGKITFDPAGNLYQTFLSSGPLLSGASGAGSFYVAKWNAAGALQWLRKHGVVPDEVTNYGFAPFNLAADGSRLYVVGSGKDSFGGPAPDPVGNTATNAVMAQFNTANGDLVDAVSYATVGFNSNLWSVGVDGQGNVFVGGGDAENLREGGAGIEQFGGPQTDGVEKFPDTSPVIYRFSQNNIRTRVWEDLIVDGDPTPGVSPERWQFSNESIGNIAYFKGLLANGSDAAIFTSGYTANGPFLGNTLGINGVWAAKYSVNGGEPIWTRSIGAEDGDQYPFATVVDADGDVYFAGQTMGRMAGEFNAGFGDGYVRKLNGATGASIWTRLIGTTEADSFHDLFLADDGFLYATGSTYGNLDGQNKGMRDVIVVKIDQDGNVVGRLQFGTEKIDWGHGVRVRNGVVYISGMTEGSLVGPYSGRGVDVFVARFSTADVN